MSEPEDDVLEALWAAVEEVNVQLPSEMQLPKDPGTALTEKERRIDSLGLVMLLSAFEKNLQKNCEIKIFFGKEDMRSDSNPLETLGSLAAFARGRRNV